MIENIIPITQAMIDDPAYKLTPEAQAKWNAYFEYAIRNTKDRLGNKYEETNDND